MTHLSEQYKVVQVLGPHDLVAAEHRTAYVHMDLLHEVTFLASFGVTTGAGATCDSITMVVEVSSIETSAGHEEIAFTYRLSDVGTSDAWGSITAGTTAGVAFTDSDLNGVCIEVSVDPAVVEAKGVNYHWVCLALTPASTTAALASVVAVCKPRYPGNTQPSST